MPLYLLDTNIPQNTPEDRIITARLYGGDNDMRIRQEMVLGIGGVRALRALGKNADRLPHERGPRRLLRPGAHPRVHGADATSISPRPAKPSPPAPCFTTHTPVPAGNDVFPPQMIEHYFGRFLPQLKIDRDEFLGLGRQNPHDHNEPFGMTVLAIRLANVTNGVSKLHGGVSRKMWKNIWPELPDAEVPITSITNGIHTQSWVSPDMIQLYERYLGIAVGRPADRPRRRGSASRTFPTPNCGGRTNAAANGWSPSPGGA